MRPGFSLFEVLIYLALVSILMLNIGDLVTYVLRFDNGSVRKEALLQLACDFFRRDIELIDPTRGSRGSLFSQWYRTKNETLECRDILWTCSRGRLVRKVGKYDRIFECWQKCVTSVALLEVQECDVTFQVTDGVISKVTLEGHTSTGESFVWHARPFVLKEAA